jgi:hypothetical protein
MSDYTLERIVPETVLVRGHYVPVVGIRVHPAGQHPSGCPLRAELLAVEVKTERGSRWYGTSHAWIGSDLRMHMLVNPRDEILRAWETPA